MIFPPGKFLEHNPTIALQIRAESLFVDSSKRQRREDIALVIKF